MSDSADLQRLERAVEVMQLVPDPIVRLDSIRQSRERLESMEAEAVRNARQAGVTWKTIGALYGLSKQGAQQRFRGRPPSER